MYVLVYYSMDVYHYNNYDVIAIAHTYNFNFNLFMHHNNIIVDMYTCAYKIIIYKEHANYNYRYNNYNLL